LGGVHGKGKKKKRPKGGKVKKKKGHSPVKRFLKKKDESDHQDKTKIRKKQDSGIQKKVAKTRHRLKK